MIEIKVTGLEETLEQLKEQLRTDGKAIIAAAMDALVAENLNDPALNRWRCDTSTGYLPSMLADGTFYKSKRIKRLRK